MYRYALFLLALLFSTPNAWAAATDWDVTDHTQVRLVAATDAVGTDKHLRMGLHFRLKKGWKVYWRSPGDAGYPPRPKWEGSRNLAHMAVHWPAPVRFSVLGLETLGYKGEVLYPLTVTLAEPGKPLHVSAAIDFLACNDICIPYRTDLLLDLPAGVAGVAAEAHDINRYMSTVPGNGDTDAAAMGFTLGTPEAISANGKTVLQVTASSHAPFVTPDMYPEGHADLRFGKPAVRLSSDRKTALLEVPVSGIKYLPNKTVIGEAVTLTITDQGRAAEFSRTVVPATGTIAFDDGSIGPSLLTILGLAILGGLILNLMPCVLPVLSIKLLSVIKHGDSDPRTVRLSFLASAAGILTAFLVLAGTLVALKSGGALVGWGIQFQQPWFLIVMTAVVSLFAFNLWGLFEVNLPSSVYDLGEKSAHVHGLGGHFLAGAFATVLATPCSAPFLGTAVGFALARGPGEIFSVFAALGVGLALPYLLVAAQPGLARLMPKPGAWMVTLKKILGGALALTALWLLSVLATTIGDLGAVLVGGLMAFGGALLWRGHRKGAVGWIGFTLVTVVALALPRILPAPTPSQEPAALKGIWHPFDTANIPALVAEGKIVFVDVTADWCITCQVNKAAVLGQDDVATSLRAQGVIAVQADWTRPNDSIARYLASFGRYGIPFNVVYGPGAPQGIVLPELLSPGSVLEALKKAKKS